MAEKLVELWTSYAPVYANIFTNERNESLPFWLLRQSRVAIWRIPVNRDVQVSRSICLDECEAFYWVNLIPHGLFQNRNSDSWKLDGGNRPVTIAYFDPKQPWKFDPGRSSGKMSFYHWLCIDHPVNKRKERRFFLVKRNRKRKKTKFLCCVNKNQQYKRRQQGNKKNPEILTYVWTWNG